mgnify:FL=1
MTLQRVLLIEYPGRSDVSKLIAEKLNGASDKKIKAKVAHIEDAIVAVEVFDPQIAIFDMDSTRRLDSLEIALAIREQSPSIRVVLASNRSNPSFAKESLISTLSGWTYWLNKPSENLDRIAQILRDIYLGNTPIPQAIVSEILTDESVLKTLTSRQHKAIALMARGLSNSAIGGEMGITAKAVERLIATAATEMGVAPANAHNNRRILTVLEYVKSVQQR